MRLALVMLCLILVLVFPPRSEAGGKGKLALVAGVSVAAFTAGVMVVAKDRDRRDSPRKWTNRDVAIASVSAGVLAGGMLYVGLSASGKGAVVGWRIGLR